MANGTLHWLIIRGKKSPNLCVWYKTNTDLYKLPSSFSSQLFIHQPEGCASVCTHSHTHTHLHTLGQLGSSINLMCLFVWEETRAWRKHTQAWGEPARGGHSRNLLVNSFTLIFNFQVGGLLQDAKNICLIYAFLCQQNKDAAAVGLLQWVQLSISSGEGD